MGAYNDTYCYLVGRGALGAALWGTRAGQGALGAALWGTPDQGALGQGSRLGNPGQESACLG
jgi:hypothetical protein